MSLGTPQNDGLEFVFPDSRLDRRRSSIQPSGRGPVETPSLREFELFNRLKIPLHVLITSKIGLAAYHLNQDGLRIMNDDFHQRNVIRQRAALSAAEIPVVTPFAKVIYNACAACETGDIELPVYVDSRQNVVNTPDLLAKIMIAGQYHLLPKEIDHAGGESPYKPLYIRPPYVTVERGSNLKTLIIPEFPLIPGAISRTKEKKNHPLRQTHSGFDQDTGLTSLLTITAIGTENQIGHIPKIEHGNSSYFSIDYENLSKFGDYRQITFSVIIESDSTYGLIMWDSTHGKQPNEENIKRVGYNGIAALLTALRFEKYPTADIHKVSKNGDKPLLILRTMEESFSRNLGGTYSLLNETTRVYKQLGQTDDPILGDTHEVLDMLASINLDRKTGRLDLAKVAELRTVKDHPARDIINTAQAELGELLLIYGDNMLTPDLSVFELMMHITNRSALANAISFRQFDNLRELLKRAYNNDTGYQMHEKQEALQLLKRMGETFDRLHAQASEQADSLVGFGDSELETGSHLIAGPRNVVQQPVNEQHRALPAARSNPDINATIEAFSSFYGVTADEVEYLFNQHGNDKIKVQSILDSRKDSSDRKLLVEEVVAHFASLNHTVSAQRVERFIDQFGMNKADLVAAVNAQLRIPSPANDGRTAAVPTPAPKPTAAMPAVAAEAVNAGKRSTADRTAERKGKAKSGMSLRDRLLMAVAALALVTTLDLFNGDPLHIYDWLIRRPSGQTAVGPTAVAVTTAEVLPTQAPAEEGRVPEPTSTPEATAPQPASGEVVELDPNNSLMTEINNTLSAPDVKICEEKDQIGLRTGTWVVIGSDSGGNAKRIGSFTVSGEVNAVKSLVQIRCNDLRKYEEKLATALTDKEVEKLINSQETSYGLIVDAVIDNGNIRIPGLRDKVSIDQEGSVVRRSDGTKVGNILLLRVGE